MKKILVIEDDSNLRTLILDILELQNFQVILAEDGFTGILLAQQQLPDLIVCDVGLPEQDGYEVLRALRQNPLLTTTPFIFLTAKGDKADLRRGMQLGADDYLTKPFSSEELLETIAVRLARQAAMQRFYTEAVPTDFPAQLALAESLSRAIERSELSLHYQPQIDLQTQTVIGAESLLRWQHSERGFVSPVEFIPLAEQTGLILSIGEWVLRTACQQARIWQSARFENVRVAVNLSARQFSQPALCDLVTQVLSETNLDPQWLDLELTESILVEDRDAAIATLQGLRLLGVQISIDDFGTGYSSLSYLQRFPIDTLKIDRSFVQNAATDSRNAAIAIAVIQMAHELELQVIAEGVETLEELTFLGEHNCDAAQGYWFSRPLPAPSFAHWLAASKN
jgi:EAL domain-containing protein (putative c-di-GMP-specific phosphodiesterase class I)/FixJ family two-component response regulator